LTLTINCFGNVFFFFNFKLSDLALKCLANGFDMNVKVFRLIYSPTGFRHYFLGKVTALGYLMNTIITLVEPKHTLNWKHTPNHNKLILLVIIFHPKKKKKSIEEKK